MDPRVRNTKKRVKEIHFGEGSGHDWFHIERVLNTSTLLAEKEKADLFTVQMTALLHDVDDPKIKGATTMCKGNAANRTLNIMAEMKLNVLESDRIFDAIREISFSKNKDKKPTTIEAAVVQDADRLDAIGAIGIARCFAYTGSKGGMIYNPADLIEITTSLSQKTYDQEEVPPSGIVHFYDKLLLVKDLMNTATGKAMAEGRHEFLETFLDQFFHEWNGKK